MREIITRQGDQVQVDDEHYNILSQFKWWTITRPHTKYAVTHVGRTTVSMHRLVMALDCGTTPDKLYGDVDHIDRCGLNNQAANLRLVSHSENCQNRKLSKLTGVHDFRGDWLAHICKNNKKIHLGTFPSPVQAAAQYDLAAIKLFGEKARLNYPENKEDYLKLLAHGVNPIPKKIPKSSRYPGVTYRKDLGGWAAYTPKIGDKHRHNIGIFDTEEEACQAREKAIKDLETGKTVKTPRQFRKTSKYLGVYLQPNGHWKVRLYHDGINYHLGAHISEEAAAEAYDLAALKLLASAAQLNFPAKIPEYRSKIDAGYELPTKNVKTSRYHGVAYRKDKKRWEAYLWDGQNKKRIRVGYFKSEEEAVRARDAKAKELFGDKAKLNLA